MNYYKASIQYDGTNYAGFQFQPNLSTIQGAINQTLENLIDGKFTTSGASRTDTGVHAHNQLIRICSESELNISSFLTSLNEALPHDILCTHFSSCEKSFRPSLVVTSKEYRYYFTNLKMISDHSPRFTANISNDLDLAIIDNCLKLFIGTHDFCNFYSSGSNVKNTVRTITSLEISIIDLHAEFRNSPLFNHESNPKSCYQLKIQGNGFLKQMIRHIVRALWLAGSGKMSQDELKILIDGPQINKQLWKVAPAKGLFLYSLW